MRWENKLVAILRILMWPALIIITLNVEKFAEYFGYDKLFLQPWDPTVTIIVDFLQSGWVQAPAMFIAGAMTALWLNRRFTRTKLPATSAPRDRTPPAPIYTAWDKFKEFKLYQAAYLWAERQPPPGPTQPGGHAGVVYEMLETALLRGELNGEMPPSLTSRVSRAELRKFAGSVSESPSFLFPEDRRSVQS